MHLIIICRIFLLNIKECIFYSAAHGNFPKYTTLQKKASFRKFIKLKMITCILCDHRATKITINSKQISEKYKNSYIINSKFLDDAWVREENKSDISEILELNENNKTIIKNS